MKPLLQRCKGMRVVWLQLLVVALAAFGLWTFLGYGVARLLLPASLRTDGLLFAPLLGYALLLLIAYYGVSTVLSLRALLPLLLIGGAAMNVLAWRCAPPLCLRRWHLSVLALAICTYISGVLPLFSYGLFAPIGENWDSEVYLPTADYLVGAPQPRIASEAPPNPLNHAPANPPGAGLALGFSCAHGLLALLTSTTALETFAPLLALLRALGAVSCLLLAQHVFGLARAWALGAGALAALHSVLLWSSLFNFGMQLGAWPLVPLGITLLASALARPAWRSAALAALVLAALPVAYYPALTLFVPAAGGVALALLLERPRARHNARITGPHEAHEAPLLLYSSLPLPFPPPLLLRALSVRDGSLLGRRLAAGLMIGALALALAGLTARDYYRGFSYRYSQHLTTLGIFEYAPLDVLLGLSPFGLNGSAAPLPAALAFAGVCLVALLAACALLSRFRWRWLGLIGGCTAYLLWLRYAQHYPYAFLKGSSYAGPLLLLAAFGGAAELYRRGAQAQRWGAFALPVRLGVCAASVGLVGLCAWAAYGTLRPYLTADPRSVPRAALEALAPLRTLPAGASVRFSDDHRLQGPTMGILAYGALGHSILGSLKTGFGALKDDQTGRLGDYALLGVNEDPARYGYASADRRWSNALLALFERPTGVAAHLVPSVPDDLIAPNELLRVYAGADTLSLRAPLAGGSGRSVSLELAVLEPATLLIGGQRLALSPGVGRFTSAPLDARGALDVQHVAGSAVYLRGLTLHEPAAIVQRGWRANAQSALLLPRTSATGSLAIVDARYLNPSGARATAYLDIWDERAGAHYGWYGVELGPNTAPQRLELRLDTRSGVLAATLDGQALVAGQQFVGLADGSYTARLGVQVGQRILAEPAPLFLMEIKGGAPQPIDAFRPRLIQAALWNPTQPANLRLGQAISLAGYDLPLTARAGQSLPLTLFWQAGGSVGEELSVLVHLRGPDGATLLTADGPPAAGTRPTSTWQVGDHIRDDRAIALPPTLAPGRYTLVVGMYRWPSLERLPAIVAGVRLPNDVLLISLDVR